MGKLDLLPGSARAFRILVVDDDEAVLETLEDIFAAWGCTVALAPSGDAALRTIESAPQDLVLMDVKMPCMDGVEAMRAMQSIAPQMPVVLMTAYAPAELIDDTGVEVLRKPLDFDRILDLVRAAAAGVMLRERAALALRADRRRTIRS